MDERTRKVTLFVILAVWGLVCLVYVLRGQLPDAQVLGIPIAAVLALGRRGKDDRPAEDNDGEDGKA